MSNLPSGIDNYVPEERKPLQYLSRNSVTVELDLYSASQIMAYLNKFANDLTDDLAGTTNPILVEDLKWLRSRVRDHATLLEQKIRRAGD